jgi:hypothetical protein
MGFQGPFFNWLCADSYINCSKSMTTAFTNPERAPRADKPFGKPLRVRCLVLVGKLVPHEAAADFDALDEAPRVCEHGRRINVILPRISILITPTRNTPRIFLGTITIPASTTVIMKAHRVFV